MATQNPTGDSADAGASTSADSIFLQWEGAALSRVLNLCPVNLRIAEIVLELAGPSTEFSVRDGYEQAIKDLIGVGLLFEAGGLIVPTRAALHFNKLVEAGAV